MTDGILRNTSHFTQLIFAVLVIIGSFLLFFFLGSLSALVFFDINPDELFTIVEDITRIENIGILKYLQIWLSLGTFVIPAFIIAYFINGNSVSYLKLNRSPVPISVINAILVMLIALPIINLLAKWNAELNLPEFLDGLETKMTEMEERAGTLTDSFLDAATIPQFALNMLMIAIIPAIGEEFLFRGVIQRILCEWTKNNHIGVIIAAIVFSTFHMQFFGFLPRLVMGLLFGYFFLWSGSIWLPVVTHFINNGLAVTVYFFYGKEFVEQDVDSLGTGSGGFFLIVLSALFAGLLIWNIYRSEKSMQKKIEMDSNVE